VKAEQVRGCRYTGPGYRRFCKKQAAKARRSAEKRDPENAPTKLRHVIRGWSD